MSNIELSIAGGAPLAVHRFAVREEVSSLFSISLWIRSKDPSLDLDALVGHPASLRIAAGYAFVHQPGARRWGGIVSRAEQTHAVHSAPGQAEHSSYHLQVVPSLWLLHQRCGNRIYQHLSIPEIIDRLLAEWSIAPSWEIDRARYPKLEHKAQYAETDYEFFCRLLEEAGIAFSFADDEAEGSRLTLSDRLEANPPRPGPPIPYADNPNEAAEKEFVTNVRLAREVRPGAFAFRDADFRRPAFALLGEAPREPAPEDRLEQYHYNPGAFLVETGKPAGTPTADDQGFARHDAKYGRELADRALQGERAGVRAVSFDANTHDLAPGAVFSIDNHHHPALSTGRKLLVVSSSLEGSPNGEWSFSGLAVFADAPFRPARRTPKPVIRGFQSAVVVGPAGQEIHTDEFGRVRVQFPWDREGKKDDHSSCWVRVTQGWGGAGWGTMDLPRIGQEVLVSFLEGDPDQPAVVGRAYNAIQRVSYKLPEHSTRSTWKSDTSLGSGGFNEIMLEDRKGKELVWQQAHKDRKRVVNNDEIATVVHDLQKLVKNHEIERTDGFRKRWVGKDADMITAHHEREAIDGSSHLEVRGSRSELVLKDQSLTMVEDQQERVEGSHALRAAQQVHHIAGEEYVGEGADDVTIRGPGGFIRIDAAGITIKGTVVKINVSGSPGAGRGSHPEPPLEALEGLATLLPELGEPLPEAETKADRVARRSALIASSRARADRMPPGSPERKKLEDAAERLERNNHAVEMAKLSQSVYQDEGAPEGWSRVSPDEMPPGLRDQVWEDKDSGFHAALFRSDEGKYVLAYRGTEMNKGFAEALKDWKANIPQSLGFETKQYNQAQRLAQAMKNTYGPEGFEITGHSLGGGLASLASVSTGARATIFNAAGLNPKTAARVGADLSDADELIQSYHVAGEILTAGQGATPMPDALGKRYNLPVSTSMLPSLAQGAGQGAALGSAIGGAQGALIGGAVGGAIGLGKSSLGRHGIEHAVAGIESQKREDEQTMQPSRGK